MFKVVCILLGLAVYCKGVYYACPEGSLCLGREICPQKNITFDAYEDMLESNFMCGVLAQCEDHVCCSIVPNELEAFTLSEETWCYPYKQLSLDVNVLPYPGWMATHLEEQELMKNLSMCASDYSCVPPSVCNDGIPIHLQPRCGAYSTNWICCLNKLLDHASLSATEMNQISSTSSLGKTVVNTINKYFSSLFNFGSAQRKSFTEDNQTDSDVDEDIVPIVAEKKVLLEPATVLNDIEPRSARQVNDWACGRTLKISEKLSRIHAPVGNHNASEGDYPWHVAITRQNNEFVCSGVVVGERTVVTVAHCVEGYSAGALMVRIGDVNLRGNTEVYPQKDVLVDSVKLHPYYDKSELTYDIAVLKLSVSLRHVPNIRPACLPDKFEADINKCRVPGWGQYSRSRKDLKEWSHVLRDARFYIISRSECQKQLRQIPKIGSFFQLQKTSVCAKGYTSADTCKGDGGSGLVCLAGDIFVLKGLVSWGLGCGQNLPGVYTDVRQFVDFIQKFEAEEFDVDQSYEHVDLKQKQTLFREEYFNEHPQGESSIGYQDKKKADKYYPGTDIPVLSNSYKLQNSRPDNKIYQADHHIIYETSKPDYTESKNYVANIKEQSSAEYKPSNNHQHDGKYIDTNPYQSGPTYIKPSEKFSDSYQPDVDSSYVYVPQSSQVYEKPYQADVSPSRQDYENPYESHSHKESHQKESYDEYPKPYESNDPSQLKLQYDPEKSHVISSYSDSNHDYDHEKSRTDRPVKYSDTHAYDHEKSYADTPVKYSDSHAYDHEKSYADTPVKYSDSHAYDHEKSYADTPVKYSDTHAYDHEKSYADTPVKYSNTHAYDHEKSYADTPVKYSNNHAYDHEKSYADTPVKYSNNHAYDHEKSYADTPVKYSNNHAYDHEKSYADTPVKYSNNHAYDHEKSYADTPVKYSNNHAYDHEKSYADIPVKYFDTPAYDHEKFRKDIPIKYSDTNTYESDQTHKPYTFSEDSVPYGSDSKLTPSYGEYVEHNSLHEPPYKPYKDANLDQPIYEDPYRPYPLYEDKNGKAYQYERQSAYDTYHDTADYPQVVYGNDVVMNYEDYHNFQETPDERYQGYNYDREYNSYSQFPEYESRDYHYDTTYRESPEGNDAEASEKGHESVENYNSEVLDENASAKSKIVKTLSKQGLKSFGPFQKPNLAKKETEQSDFVKRASLVEDLLNE